MAKMRGKGFHKSLLQAGRQSSGHIRLCDSWGASSKGGDDHTVRSGETPAAMATPEKDRGWYRTLEATGSVVHYGVMQWEDD